MEIGLVLKTARKKLGLTQEEVATKIYVSQKSVSNWETGKTLPDIESLIRLAQLYQLSLDNLLLEGSAIVKDIQTKTNIKRLEHQQNVSLVINAIISSVFFAKILFGLNIDDKMMWLLILILGLNFLNSRWFIQEIQRQKNPEEKPINKFDTSQKILIGLVIGGIALGIVISLFVYFS